MVVVRPVAVNVGANVAGAQTNVVDTGRKQTACEAGDAP
jgi:hypothetical protein